MTSKAVYQKKVSLQNNPVCLYMPAKLCYTWTMEPILKSDIFFFISSLSSILLTILFAVALYYFIRAGRNLYHISQKLHERYDQSEAYLLELKDRLENNVFLRMFLPPRGKNRSTRKDTVEKPKRTKK